MFNKILAWAGGLFCLLAVVCGLISWATSAWEAAVNAISPVKIKTPRELSNLEKLAGIDIDLEKAQIYKNVLQQQFQQDPLANRVAVEKHRRKRFMLIDRAQEEAMAQQFMSKLDALGIYWNDGKAMERCNKILNRLTGGMPEKYPAPHKVYLVDIPEVNAFCLPDGTIVVFRGLVEALDDDELAWVLAHELGHGIAHHAAERISKGMIQELAIDTFIDKDTETIKFIGSIITAFAANLKYDRIQEDEADRLGVFYVSRAGFDTQGAVRVLNKFKSTAGKNVLWKELLATHPHPEKRLKNVNKAIAQLQKNPDHNWGSLKDDLLEASKVKAIKYYLEKKQNSK